MPWLHLQAPGGAYECPAVSSGSHSGDAGPRRAEPAAPGPDSAASVGDASRDPQSILFSSLFGDPAVAAVFSQRAHVQRMLDVELAIAGAEADLEMIPAAAAEAIARVARADRFDLAALARDAAQSGNLAIPLVRQLTAAVAAEDPDAARYVHWGATSQDVIDTALVLQLRDAMPHVLGHLRRAGDAAAAHAQRHIETPMAGRTWLQQATPVTFGLKAAGWVDAIDRQCHLIEDALRACSVLQFGGASGTLASLGTMGTQVSDILAATLRLSVPEIPWHGHRDRLVRLGCTLGVAIGVLGKIGRDLALLAQTEVAEAMEAPAEGRGGSSTMPQKRNPIAASVALAAATRAPGLVAALLAGMGQEHERGLGGWQAEWVTVPELVLTAAGAARAIADALEHLMVDPARMRQNLDATGGLTLAEAISMALAERLGKSQAHQLVERAARRSAETKRSLAETLSEIPEVTACLPPEEIRERLTPEHYLGSARTFVERVLARRRP